MEQVTWFQGVERESTAYKLLAKMGWQEGQGLGAQRQGITTHVRVAKKADASGVGAEQAAAKARDWTLGMAAYDRVLANLKVVSSANEATESGADAASEPSSTEANEMAAAREAKKRKRLQPAFVAPDKQPEASVTTAVCKKKRRKVSQASDHSAPLTLAPHQLQAAASPVAQELSGNRSKRGVMQGSKKGTTEEGRQPVQMAQEQDTRKQATHVGRFKKFARGKCVKGYSSNDLTAILGGGGQLQHQQDEEPQKQLPRSMSAPQSPAQVLAAPSQTEGPAETISEESDTTETGSLWWHGHFTQAGRCGSAYAAFASETQQREVKVAGFSEADQANLWQNVTDAQSKAKQGLGQGSVPRKVAGVKWQGSKKRISDSDSEEEAQQSLEQLQQPADPALEQAVILPPKCRSAPDLTAGMSGSNQAAKVKPAGLGLVRMPSRRIKWKKIAQQILNPVDGQKLGLKAFKGRAWEMASQKGVTDRQQSSQTMLDVLTSSKHFVVGAKTIALRQSKATPTI